MSAGNGQDRDDETRLDILTLRRDLEAYHAEARAKDERLDALREQIVGCRKDLSKLMNLMHKFDDRLSRLCGVEL